MVRRSNRCVALLALGVLSLIPAGASAGPLFGHAPDAGAAPHYSPWHYRTPLLYRKCVQHYYGLGLGSYLPGRYPVGPVGPYPYAAANPGDLPSGATPVPGVGSPEADGPEQ
jgi:hypothetical protein